MFGACSITWTKSSGGTGHPPDLSVFSLYIRAMASDSPFILQLFIFLPVVYIAWCAYSSLFQLRLFNYYHIVGHHMSDSNSLLFSAAYLCRLTAPMAYNFMQMAHYGNTEFVAVMGNLDVEGLEYKDTNVGHYFQLFFPVLLLPFILMTLFDVYSRIMGLLHIKRFQFTDDFDHSLIADGQEILNEERQRLSRGLGPERPEQTVLENQNPSLPPSDDLKRGSYEESDSEDAFSSVCNGSFLLNFILTSIICRFPRTRKVMTASECQGALVTSCKWDNNSRADSSASSAKTLPHMVTFHNPGLRRWMNPRFVPAPPANGWLQHNEQVHVIRFNPLQPFLLRALDLMAMEKGRKSHSQHSI